MKQNIKFDPCGPAPENAGIFGLPYSEAESKLILIPVPWEATTSYGGGTSKGPQAILKASHQIDLFDMELGRFYEAGVKMLPHSKEIYRLNTTTKKEAQKIIKAGGEAKNPALRKALTKVNAASRRVNELVYNQTKKYLNSNKLVGLVGGDHSTPFGSIQAHLEKYPQMGILHFDAHADLRAAYEGFEHSHASIMYNVIKKMEIQKLVQVGIRDFSTDEFDLIKSQAGRIKTFFDEELSELKYSGVPWKSLCKKIIEELPKEVYLSFDIDGLDPALCPGTGTPVPGGLEFQEALVLIKEVVKSGRRIVGFDLNEVSPFPNDREWNANVGARLLFKICGWALKSTL